VPVPPGAAGGDGAAPADDLAIFAELPVVVSASRQPTALTLSSAPVSVLTAEDIHAGGHTTIAEALQFTLGIDVARNDRNVYSLGVRGLHGTFSDRTLTLVDGRNADSPVYGGSEFMRLPLFLEDIDHIEVVRGPGGGAWGANAFNGVINIITKEPEDMLGVFAISNVTAFGDSSSEARWCESAGRWSWRTSVGYHDHVSSRRALGDNDLPDTDWLHGGGTDNEVVFHLDETTKLSAGLGYALDRGGAFEFLGTTSDEQAYHRTTRAFARLDHRFAADAGYQVEWYGDYAQTYQPAVEKDRSRENGFDGQLDLAPCHDHRLSIGTAIRNTMVEILDTGDPTLFTFGGSPYHESIYGGYLTDRWQALDRLAVEGQVREDRYGGTGDDWAGRLSVLWTMDRERAQVLRMSVAKSYRTPLNVLRNAEDVRPVGGNPFVLFAVVPADHLVNEETWSAELGYSNQLSDELLVRWDGYYQRYEHLIGFRFTPPTAGPPFVTTAQPANIAGAQGYGSELELEWKSRVGRWSLWYAVHGFETDQEDQDIRAFRPPLHGVGATSRTDLGRGLTFTIDYRYASSTIDPSPGAGTHVDITHHLDTTLGWRFDHERSELMIGVLDLLERADPPVLGSGSAAAHVTPGRTFFIRGEWGF
jgi:iron complex outermembrane receptor protein